MASPDGIRASNVYDGCMGAPLDQALALHRRGLHVFPVPRPRPGVPDGQPGDGKVPVLSWRPYQQQQPTMPELGTWFATEQNLAVITGAGSGVVVVDADSRDGVHWVTRHLPYTPWQTKTSRGFHLYYGHPGVKVRNRSRVETREGKLKIDVRGDGGYAIAAGWVWFGGRLSKAGCRQTIQREQVWAVEIPDQVGWADYESAVCFIHLVPLERQELF